MICLDLLTNYLKMLKLIGSFGDKLEFNCCIIDSDSSKIIRSQPISKMPSLKSDSTCIIRY